VRISLRSPIASSTLSLLVAIVISTENSFTLFLSFDLNTLERPQLYKICPYMGLLFICPWVYNSIYTSSYTSCFKVHFNVIFWLYNSVGLLSWSINTISFFQYRPCLGNTWSSLGGIRLLLLFGTKWITIMAVLSGIEGWLCLTIFVVQSLNSVTSCFLHYTFCFLTTQTSCVHFFQTTSLNCQQIN